VFEWEHSPSFVLLSVRAKQLLRGRDEIHVRVREWEVDMLWTVLVVLLILWLLGFSLHIGGGTDPLTPGCGVGGSGH
jgi:hypothetical protein